MLYFPEYHFNFTSNHNLFAVHPNNSFPEYHFNFTSNHNTATTPYKLWPPEYHFNFTSNHNLIVIDCYLIHLNIISILHQTTTYKTFQYLQQGLNIISILHQTTTLSYSL